MNIYSAKVLIKHHIRSGILARWKWYMLSILIFGIQWGLAYQYFSQLKYIDTALPCATYMDYVLFFFRGLAPKASAIDQQFILPIPWICIFMGNLVCAIDYSGVNIDKHVIQIIIRSNSRKTWWFSRCVWCMLSTLFYYSIGYFTLIALCTFTKTQISLSATAELLPLFLGADESIVRQPLSLLTNAQLGFIMPVLFSFSLNMMQLVLNLFTSQSRALVVCLSVLILSAYYTTDYAIGNYSIVMRSSCIVKNGFNPQVGQAVYLFLILILYSVGLLKAYHLDFLPNSKERG